jgi:hypothetical protein
VHEYLSYKIKNDPTPMILHLLVKCVRDLKPIHIDAISLGIRSFLPLWSGENSPTSQGRLVIQGLPCALGFNHMDSVCWCSHIASVWDLKLGYCLVLGPLLFGSYIYQA